MTVHAEDALRGARISEIFNLSFTVATLEAVGAEGLISGQDGEVLDLVAAAAATVGTVIADERSITEEKQVCVRVEESATSVASKAVDVPSVPSYQSQQVGLVEALSGRPYQARTPSPLPGSAERISEWAQWFIILGYLPRHSLCTGKVHPRLHTVIQDRTGRGQQQQP